MAHIRERQDAAYRKLREELLEAESALVEQRERVASLRRRLPRGTPVETDYVFEEGPRDLGRSDPAEFFETRLSELFEGEKDELLVEHMMFAPDAEKGCPMCSMWVDGLDGVVHHLEDRVNVAVVARAPLARLREWGRRRGWRRVRLLSSERCDFNRDLGAELSPERQLPGYSVFTRDADGTVRHFYTTEGSLVERHHRAMDLFTPVWNVFDLLPSGRGDWMPRHSYE